MGKSISDNQKKQRRRGRPKTTGTTPMTGVRFSAELENAILEWANKQTDKPNKAEAIRRLVEQSLTLTSNDKPVKKQKAQRASELADRAVERVVDKSMPVEEQERRKRALIKGPKEFRDIREDLPKPKRG